MGARIVILLFVIGFAALTIDALIEKGVTLPGVVSLLVLALLSIGVIGSLRQPPRK